MLWREESYKEIVRLNNTPSLHGAWLVLAWVSERLAVAMRQAEDEDNVLDKPTLIDLEARWGDKGQAKAAWETKWDGPKGMR